MKRPPYNKFIDDTLTKEHHLDFILDPDLVNDFGRSALGEMISSYRKRAGLTLRSLAENEKCSTTKTNIFHIESGSRLPNDSLYKALVEVLDIPYDKAEKINQLRLYFLMESRNRHLSEVLELSVNLLSMKKNTARGLALLALLKSALARFDLNYPREDLFSSKAKLAEIMGFSQENLVARTLIEKKHILSFIDEYNFLFFSKKNLLLLICIFSKKVVLLENEHNRLKKKDVLLNMGKFDRKTDDVENFNLFISKLYEYYNNYGIKIEPLHCFGREFNEVLKYLAEEYKDIKKKYVWEKLGGKNDI